MNVVIIVAGYCITIEPPQRVLLLQVTCESDGSGLTIFHVSGNVYDGELLSARPLAKTSLPRDETVDRPSGVPSIVLQQFPSISVFDLSRLPADYKMEPDERGEPFVFRRGETYIVSVVSDRIVETRVAAQ